MFNIKKSSFFSKAFTLVACYTIISQPMYAKEHNGQESYHVDYVVVGIGAAGA